MCNRSALDPSSFQAPAFLGHFRILHFLCRQKSVSLQHCRWGSRWSTLQDVFKSVSCALFSSLSFRCPAPAFHSLLAPSPARKKFLESQRAESGTERMLETVFAALETSNGKSFCVCFRKFFRLASRRMSE